MDAFREFLSKTQDLRVVVLTGAGVSAESGIRTFRDCGGLWEKHRVEEVATPMAFEKNPDLVYRFYNERRKQLFTVEPNRAHIGLSQMESLALSEFNLITQNVDDLHEKGGSGRVIHMHGELLKARCLDCESVFHRAEDLDSSSKCEKCGGKMRPHIVWFHEIPLFMEKIESIVKACNLFIAIGTGGSVYPAAGFSMVAKNGGAFTMEINVQRTGGVFDTCLEGRATEKVEEVVSELKNHYDLRK